MQSTRLNRQASPNPQPTPSLKARISPHIEYKYEQLRNKYGARLEEVSEWMVSLYSEKLKEMNNLLQKYELEVKIRRDKEIRLKGITEEMREAHTDSGSQGECDGAGSG